MIISGEINTTSDTMAFAVLFAELYLLKVVVSILPVCLRRPCCVCLISGHFTIGINCPWHDVILYKYITVIHCDITSDALQICDAVVSAAFGLTLDKLTMQFCMLFLLFTVPGGTLIPWLQMWLTFSLHLMGSIMGGCVMCAVACRGRGGWDRTAATGTHQVSVLEVDIHSEN